MQDKKASHIPTLLILHAMNSKNILVFLFFKESPSPRITIKFKNQLEDPVNGNDYVKRHFGSNASL